MMTSPQPGPLAPYVVPFVVELRATGFCASTISVFSRTVRCFDQWLRRKRIKVRQIDEGVIQQHHRYRQRLRMQSHGADAALRRLLLRLREWEACPARQEAPPSAIEVFLAYFRDHLAAHRGLAPSTIRVRIAVAHRFLRLYPLHTSVGASMSIGAAVSAFIRTEAQGHGPQTAKALAAGLRALLRFLAFRGAIDAKAVDCVPAVAQWRMVSIPRHLTRDQLRKLLSIPDRTSVVGRRDYAILLLLARLGLRSTEVVRLTLGDIDWRGHCLSVRSKGGGRSQLPLLPEIECAIADYMRHSRPQSASRRVFLTSRAPYRGFLDGTGVSAIVQSALHQVGVSGPRCGAHILRHTLATDLLRRGMPLTRIGLILRHQHPDTTRIYAKVDCEGLRRRALIWPGVAS